MGNVVDLFKKNGKGGKNDLMLVCEDYYKDFYELIPRTEDYKDSELERAVQEGAVLALKYENFHLVPFVANGLLRMRMFEAVAHFEVTNGVGRLGPFNKLTPIYKKGKERTLKNDDVYFVPDKVIGVCLKDAYINQELMSVDNTEH